jgi:hypothetical protein
LTVPYREVFMEDEDREDGKVGDKSIKAIPTHRQG